MCCVALLIGLAFLMLWMAVVCFVHVWEINILFQVEKLFVKFWANADETNKKWECRSSTSTCECETCWAFNWISNGFLFICILKQCSWSYYGGVLNEFNRKYWFNSIGPQGSYALFDWNSLESDFLKPFIGKSTLCSIILRSLCIESMMLLEQQTECW